jgi:hypothetical protein
MVQGQKPARFPKRPILPQGGGAAGRKIFSVSQFFEEKNSRENLSSAFPFRLSDFDYPVKPDPRARKLEKVLFIYNFICPGEQEKRTDDSTITERK